MKKQRDLIRESRIAIEVEKAKLGHLGHYALAVLETVKRCEWYGESKVPVARIWKPFHPRFVSALIDRFHKDSRYNKTTGSNDIRLDKQWTLADAIKVAQDFYPYVVLIKDDRKTREILRNPDADVYLPELTAFEKLGAPVLVDLKEVCDQISCELDKEIESIAIFTGVNDEGFSTDFYPKPGSPDAFRTNHSRLLIRASTDTTPPRYLAIDSQTLEIELAGYHHEPSAARLIATWHDAIAAGGGQTVIH